MYQRVPLKLGICILLVATLLAVPQNVFSTSQSRLMYGSVISTVTGQPIVGVLVATHNCGFSDTAYTGSDGTWQLNFPYGTYGTLSFSASGYKTRTYQITYNANWIYAGGTVSLSPL